MIKDPDNFRCFWCGNPVLALTWTEIMDMLRIYREIKGRSALAKTAKACGKRYQHMYQYLAGAIPNYETGRRIGLFLRDRFDNLNEDEVSRFRELYLETKV